MGLTVLDAGVVIATLEQTDAHHGSARRAVSETRSRGDRLILPAAAYAEVLVNPSQRGAEAVATVDAFIDALPAFIEPISRDIAAAAAMLRARHGRAVRLPDALVLATAQIMSADKVITTDAHLPQTEIVVDVIRGQ